MGLFSGVRQKNWAPDDDRWYGNIWGLLPTATGIRVDAFKALQHPAVFDCARILGEDVGSLPLFMYKRLDPRGKIRDPSHHLYRPLHSVANPEMSAMTFRETLQGHLALWGNGYANIVRDRGGRVRELWPLRPDRMNVGRDPETGELQYKYTLPKKAGFEQVPLTRHDVLHIPGLGFDGITGYNPIDLFREAIALGLAMEEYGARFFGNDARPGLILEHPAKMKPDAVEQVRKSTEEKHQGLGKAHRLMILEEGVKIHEVGIPPATGQFLESRRFQITEIARMFRMPLQKLGVHDAGTSYASAEQFAQDYVTDTLRPWSIRWEQAIYMQLLSPADQETHFAEHLFGGLLRGDTKSRYGAYAIGRQWGWLSANDIREMENLNPVDGGDTYLEPLNMVPAGQPRTGDQAARSVAAALDEISRKLRGEEAQNTDA